MAIFYFGVLLCFVLLEPLRVHAESDCSSGLRVEDIWASTECISSAVSFSKPFNPVHTELVFVTVYETEVKVVQVEEAETVTVRTYK